MIAGLAGGGLTALAFPPVDLWWLAPVGLAILHATARGGGLRAGAGAGAGFGMGLFTPLLHFTAVAMGNALGWVALTITESLYLVALGAAWAAVSRLRALSSGPRAGWWRALSFALLWCGAEELRSSWPWGGFPFGRLAFAMADAPVLPLAAYGGSIGLSLLVALLGAVLAEIVIAARARAVGPAFVGAAAAACLVAAPAALPVASAPEQGTIRVGAVQGNVALDHEDAFNRALEVTGNHARATVALGSETGPGTLDMVIWPENAADLDPRHHAPTAALVEQAAQAVQAPIIVGAVPYEGEIRYNDMVVWTPGAGAGEYYRKHLPVPFAEYVPMRGLIRRVTDQVDRIGTDMVAGTGPQTLTVHAAVADRQVTLAMGICFEVAYDDVLRRGIEQGGQMIVVPTNNASFLHSSEAAQQLAQGRVQAVIHGRSVVQVSTVGITAIIAPTGAVEQRTAAYTRAGLVADVGLRSSVTTADRLGPWPGRALLLGALSVTMAGMLRFARDRVGARRQRTR